MVLDGDGWCWMVLDGVGWRCMVLDGWKLEVWVVVAWEAGKGGAWEGRGHSVLWVRGSHP